ncbi:Anaphase-promoting complex subunit 10 [Phlyctochytrium planicorne]|nr:Anaphase-promoting complex subunit 10 [Phlyctochytrium planicorne]
MSDLVESSRDVFLADLRDVSSLGTWFLSSQKTGFGVNNLRDDNLDTYWQSDGPQPHWINIHFPKKIDLQMISLYVDYKQDESYTPSRISVRAGNNVLDLEELFIIDLEEPSGWIDKKVMDIGSSQPRPLRAQMLQIAILANHQNGKDTHLRQIKIWASKQYVAKQHEAGYLTTSQLSIESPYGDQKLLHLEKGVYLIKQQQITRIIVCMTVKSRTNKYNVWLK